MQDNLPELRDIHLPEDVSIFPPAYGWWIILFAVIVSILIYKAIYTAKRKSKKFYALKLLSQINSNNIIPAAIEISEILRRICVYKYSSANALFGKDWVLFLNNHSKSKLKEKTAELLINAPYIPKDSNKYDITDINDLMFFVKSWIGENL